MSAEMCQFPVNTSKSRSFHRLAPSLVASLPVLTTSSLLRTRLVFSFFGVFLRILLISFLLSAELWRCPHQFILFASTYNLKFHYIIVFSYVSPFFCSLCLLGFTLLYLPLLILYWLCLTPIILIGITNIQHILIVIWASLILGVLFFW
jgi:hypothetical protein